MVYKTENDIVRMQRYFVYFKNNPIIERGENGDSSTEFLK